MHDNNEEELDEYQQREHDAYEHLLSILEKHNLLDDTDLNTAIYELADAAQQLGHMNGYEG